MRNEETEGDGGLINGGRQEIIKRREINGGNEGLINGGKRNEGLINGGSQGMPWLYLRMLFQNDFLFNLL